MIYSVRAKKENRRQAVNVSRETIVRARGRGFTRNDRGRAVGVSRETIEERTVKVSRETVVGRAVGVSRETVVGRAVRVSRETIVGRAIGVSRETACLSPVYFPYCLGIVIVKVIFPSVSLFELVACIPAFLSTLTALSMEL